MPTKRASVVSSETFVITHPCKYEVYCALVRAIANQQLFGLATNGSLSTPNALARVSFPKGLRAVDNFPNLLTKTPNTKDTRGAKQPHLMVVSHDVV